MTKDDGGPAFPVETYGDGRGVQTSPQGGWSTGLTQRDYFAAAVLPALAAYAMKQNSLSHPWPVTTEEIAQKSYVFADAMLKARGDG